MAVAELGILTRARKIALACRLSFLPRVFDSLDVSSYWATDTN